MEENNNYGMTPEEYCVQTLANKYQITKEQVSAEYYLIGTLLSTACVVVCKVVLL